MPRQPDGHEKQAPAMMDRRRSSGFLPTANFSAPYSQEEMKTLLTEAIFSLLRSSLNFSEEMSVEALVGVTVDKQNVLLMNINKTVTPRENNNRTRESLKRKSNGVSSVTHGGDNNVLLFDEHAAWNKDAQNVIVKTEPRETNVNYDPHSELRAHLQNGNGCTVREALINSKFGQVRPVQQDANLQNGIDGSKMSTTRSVLFQHLQNQQQQKLLQERLQQNQHTVLEQQQQQQQQQVIDLNAGQFQQLQKNIQQQSQSYLQQHQHVNILLHKQQLLLQQVQSNMAATNLDLSVQKQQQQIVSQPDSNVDPLYISQVSSSMSSSPLSSHPPTPLSQCSPQNFPAFTPEKSSHLVTSASSLEDHINSNVMQCSTVASDVNPAFNPVPCVQTTVSNHYTPAQLQLAVSQMSQSQNENNQSVLPYSFHINTEVQDVQQDNNAVSNEKNDTALEDISAVADESEEATQSLLASSVNQPQNNNEEVDDNKPVIVGLDADDDSDQESFSSPEKSKRRKSLIIGDVFLGCTVLRPTIDCNSTTEKSSTTFGNWNGSGNLGDIGSETSSNSIQVKQELPDWSKCYGGDEDSVQDDSEEGDVDVEDEDEDEDDQGEDGVLPNGNFVNEMLEQMEVSADGEKTCPICRRILKAKSDMGRHIRTHTKEKPHKCEDCGRGFLQSYDLKRHRMQHSGFKPFQCFVCSKGFTRPDYLRNHQQVWHPELYKDC